METATPIREDHAFSQWYFQSINSTNNTHCNMRTENNTKNPMLLAPAKEPFITRGGILANVWDEGTAKQIATPYAINHIDRIERRPKGYVANRMAHNRRVSQIEQ